MYHAKEKEKKSGGGIEILLYILDMQENCSIFNETRVLDGGLSSFLGVKAEELM